MNKKFAEYKQFNLPEINAEVLKTWQKEHTFEQSLKTREGSPAFIFYEGPPSANGKPGIHHVLARTIKDSVLRYFSAKGYRVDRKAGWDTHGLPVELGVEQSLAEFRTIQMTNRTLHFQALAGRNGDLTAFHDTCASS